MTVLVFDRIGQVQRSLATGLLCALAAIVTSRFGAYSGSIFLLAAAIVYHADAAMTIDWRQRTFQLRRLIKPFGSPVSASFDDIQHVRMDVLGSFGRQVYAATIVFRLDGVTPFRIASGDLDQVLACVTNLRKLTRLDLVESPAFRQLREQCEAASALLRSNP